MCFITYLVNFIQRIVEVIQRSKSHHNGIEKRADPGTIENRLRIAIFILKSFIWIKTADGWHRNGIDIGFLEAGIDLYRETFGKFKVGTCRKTNPVVVAFNLCKIAGIVHSCNKVRRIFRSSGNIQVMSLGSRILQK
ncbi:hypothetical protein D3C86_1267200 [compost metagenome]